MAVVIAHRTLPRHGPENSLSGIQRAVAEGADYVEVDIRRTRDGVPVLLHDPTLLRTGWRPRRIRSMMLDDVARVRLRGGHNLPTLADALAQAPAGLGFALDTKDPGAAPATLAAVAAAGMGGRVLLWSQHDEAVRHYVARAPAGTQVALLRDTTSPAETARYLDDTARLGATAVSVHQSVLDEALITTAHERGLAVHCWFQSLEVQAAKAALPVDGIVTDWPADAVRRLAALGPR
ncbi:MAG: glycerophosphodiester phosphodiesterase [Acidimicrobiales bacterium]